jgi:hypothetical protein
LFIRLSYGHGLRAARGFERSIKYGAFKYGVFDAKNHSFESFGSKPLPYRRAAPSFGR